MREGLNLSRDAFGQARPPPPRRSGLGDSTCRGGRRLRYSEASPSKLEVNEMRIRSVIAPLLVGLSLSGLTCQEAKRAAGEGAGAAASPTASPAAAQQQPSAPQTHLKVGDPAPDFELTDT